MPTRNFCTTAELAAELGNPDLGVIDASWHLPNTGRIGAAEFRFAHIPGAVFFDIDTIADLEQGLPHMLPKPEALAKAMSALGLGDGMRLVVYDALGLFAAARVWWTLRAYGVEEVRILQGGLTQWVKEGRPVEAGAARPGPPRSFTPQLDESFVAHQYIIAAQAAWSADLPDGYWGCQNHEQAEVALITKERVVTGHRKACYDYQTLGDELDKADLSWRFYASQYGSGSSGDGGTWSSYQAIKHIYNGPD